MSRTDPAMRRDPARHRHRLAVIAYDVECGLHSGIPPCCVEHFILHWSLLSSRQQRPHRDLMDACARRIERRTGRPFSFGYVPCPKCARAGRRVRLKQCREQDHATRAVLAEHIPHLAHWKKGPATAPAKEPAPERG